MLENMAVGSVCPNFTLKDNSGDDWRLDEHAGSVVVLLFYPGNETMVCTKQLCSLRDHWEKYLDTKADIVGISPADPENHDVFARKYRLPIPLLADPERVVTRRLAKHWFYPISFTRAIVVVDAKGIIREREIMLRAFRPEDESLITAIYAARGDAAVEKYSQMRAHIRTILLR